MKQMEVESERGNAKLKQAVPPPPPPPRPNSWAKTKISSNVSVTNQEIAKFWRRKRIEEDDHLLSAIKAAARIRAQKLSKEDYKNFEDSLKEDEETTKGGAKISNSGKTNECVDELRVEIKDWWTKCKYAYLNQPAIESMDPPKDRSSTYIPNFCNYKPPSLPTASFGIF